MNTFPICGSRQAVWDALTVRGFVMSGFSDKHWLRADGVTAHVYGAGSQLKLSGASADEGPIGEVLERLDRAASKAHLIQ